MTVPILLDTDPGVDDAMAILYALADPAIELVGLTTVFGNVPGKTALRNALALIDLAGFEVPVSEGAAAPLVQQPHPHPDFVHGVGGFGDVQIESSKSEPDPRPAPQFIAETLAERPGEITLIAVGPFTNLAHALEHDPGITKNVKQVILMGGAVRCSGNVNEHAEANIWQDTHAAAKVLAADWPVTLVGLDVTEQVIVTPDDLAPMRKSSPICGTFMNDAAAFYFRFHRESEGIDGCHLHDPTAIIATLDPDAFGTVEAPLAVTLDGEAAGRTSEDDSAASPSVRVCLKIDSQQIKKRFLDHMCSGRLP